MAASARYVLGLAVGLILGVIVRAEAVKPGACMDELDRVRTELRLRTAELQVARGQLRTCERR